MSGLTDEQKADFNCMKDIAVFTRLPPQQRVNALKQYIRNVKG